MIVGVDAGCLGIKDKRLKVGVYQVAVNILSELGRLDKKNTYLLYSFHPIDKKLLKGFGPRMKNIIVKPVRGWLQVWLPIRIAKDKVDVFIALSQALPRKSRFGKKYKKIALFHDLTFEKFPALYSQKSLKQLRQISKSAAKNADIILSVSKTTKKDLEQLYKVNGEKVRVLYPYLKKRAEKVVGGFKKFIPYFLFVGALKQQKNIPTLLEAFAAFISTSKKEYNLLLVGGDKWYDSAISTFLFTLPKKVADRIKFLGFVTDDQLIYLYKHAVAFVSPSFYEGFGLSFLDAMSNNCLIIGSKSGSIPEIVGTAGLLISAESPKEIAKAMYSISENKKQRDLLTKNGKKRLNEIQKENFGRKILESIQE